MKHKLAKCAEVLWRGANDELLLTMCYTHLLPLLLLNTVLYNRQVLKNSVVNHVITQILQIKGLI